MTRPHMVGTVLLLLATATGAAGQTARVPTERPLPPGATLTQQLLLATYPELGTRAIAWRITTVGPAVVLDAREPLPPGRDAAARDALADAAGPPLVRAQVDVDADGALVAFRLDGVLPRPAALVAARATAAPVDALAKVPGTLGPDAADPAGALMTPPLARLLSVRRVASATFDTAPSESTEALTWRVEVDSDAKDSPSYTLTFEPVEGRLLSVVRR